MECAFRLVHCGNTDKWCDIYRFWGVVGKGSRAPGQWNIVHVSFFPCLLMSLYTFWTGMHLSTFARQFMVVLLVHNMIQASDNGLSLVMLK